MTQTVQFNDGASYEVMMGRWSRLAGDLFLDWLAVPEGLRWVDVGCGNGAFTEQLVERTRASHVVAVDPSPGQLAFARTRLPAGAPVEWLEGGAQQLPVADGSCDAATMALVLFFVPDPAAGVAEMVRAVRPGGVVAAYHWDMLNRGFPLADIGAEMVKLGARPPMPPSADASTLEASAALWTGAGLRDVETRSITVQRTFDSFDDYWHSAASSQALRTAAEVLTAEQQATLKANVRLRLQADGGPVTVTARATAVRGVRP
ncbi:class I SAM-dependent methyltransferase [Piscinibacter gummiphilus]|uniref:Uncharacterized protein n=1 Tax=Piscinibacter gummiphilus TaxID=946333 RepID=A0A1W6L4B3_9BURK|nr:class I SAM-dependent methyltransferase [Piscinibacter gummiphilus]ARN19027.1 hypothetical protein A4W93_03330 [Piscinibacter gummiphilus]ATU63672.1 class I SAM-dependent methyltransferase [Piscinibacter gummiphilus]GLS93398.1 SAM-dependent methyltransferase [Piscinibacter gummiphilus]